MIRAFKFLRSEDLPKVLKDGTLWLASTASIRAADTGSAGYGDKDEALTYWAPPGGEYVIDRHHPLARHVGAAFEGLRTLDIEEGAEFRMENNGLLFCTCASRSPEIVERMKAEFGYDASFAIPDLKKLSHAIARQVGERGGYLGPVQYCDYDPRTADAPKRTALFKSAKFEWQQEIRLVLPSPGESRAVKVPGLWRFVSGVRLHP